MVAGLAIGGAAAIGLEEEGETLIPLPSAGEGGPRRGSGEGSDLSRET
jgi:hypothetical protein